jgi:SAM-dependent methyltransferase
MAEMIEVHQEFKTEMDFREWSSRTIIEDLDIDIALRNIRKNGIKSNFFGPIHSNHISTKGDNLREQLFANRLNSRQRAVLEILMEQGALFHSRAPKIYATEAVTELALALRHRYPFFIGSEYAPEPLVRERLYPIPHQSLLGLDLPSGAFDAAITCDVLEHVPDIPRSLAELARILKVGGVMLSTHPFTWKESSVVKAALTNGDIIHLEEPEFHGNPLDPEAGSLVFTVPGWEIVDWCLHAGFSQATMVIYASESKGVLSRTPPYINILLARK